MIILILIIHIVIHSNTYNTQLTIHIIIIMLYIYIYIYTYIHTYIHTYTHSLPSRRLPGRSGGLRKVFMALLRSDTFYIVSFRFRFISFLSTFVFCRCSSLFIVFRFLYSCLISHFDFAVYLLFSFSFWAASPLLFLLLLIIITLLLLLLLPLLLLWLLLLL